LSKFKIKNKRSEKMKKKILLVLTTIIIFSFVGCNSSQNTKSDEETEVNDTILENGEDDEKDSQDRIIVYLSGPEAMITNLEEEFEKENGDVLDMNIMSCGQLRSKVWAESQAGSIQADVIWGSDPLIYNKLDDLKLLMPLNIKEFEKISSQYLWAGKNYALVNERYVIIMYNNTMLIDEIPESFADLTDEKYKNIAVMADASQSSTAFAIASSLYELMGNNNNYFQSLKNNGIMLSKSNGLVPSQIMEGQFAVGIAPHDSIIRLQNKAEKEGYEVTVKAVWPREGVISLQRPIAIPVDDNRSNKQQEIANKFVNFMLSKKAQMITANFGFVSVRNDIENTYLPEEIESFSVDWDAASENEENIKNEYQQIFH